MIDKNSMGTKPIYEPRKVMKLDGRDMTLGACYIPGSGDHDECSEGNSAGGTCFKTGSAALAECEWSGNSAVNCTYDGNSPG